MQYSEKKIMRILKGEADVPKEVTARIDQTIRQIKENSGDRNMRKRGFRCHAAAAVAVIILFGTVTAGAAGFFLWNQDVAEMFGADEAQQRELVQKKVTGPVEADAEDQGVTISLEQSLATEKYMYLYFKITAPKGMKLSERTFFEEQELLVDGERLKLNYSGGIQEGTKDPEEHVIYWEYFVKCSERDYMNGKELTAHFQNMIQFQEDRTLEPELVQEGSWDVSWTVEYASTEQMFEINQPLQGSDTVVKNIVISPISMEVTYDLPRKKVPIQAYTEDGETEERFEWAEPDVIPSQYRMKDGTLEDIVTGVIGSAGYLNTDESDTTYVTSFGCRKVYSTDEICGVVFVNQNTNQTYELTLR